MKVSYDYNDLIEELNDELADHELTKDSTIQILRDENGYIIDWYYDDKTMIEIIKPDILDSFIEDYREQYLNCKENLQQATVENILEEMVRMNKIV